MPIPRFTDRQDAGNALIPLLRHYAHQEDTIILALPRGGLPVARPIADALELPLDVFLVRKIGVSWDRELAMGAVAMGDVHIRNDALIRSLHISEEMFERALEQERKELSRREKLYHPRAETPNLEDKTLIIVDDGLATGATMQVAIRALQDYYHPATIVVAVPVLAQSAYDSIVDEVNAVIYVIKPSSFHAVGEWYVDFSQVSDSEALELLKFSEQM